MICRLKPEKRLLQVIYLNFVRYGRQLKSRSIYFLFSKRPTFADFGCDFESVRRLLDPHCSFRAQAIAAHIVNLHQHQHYLRSELWESYPDGFPQPEIEAFCCPLPQCAPNTLVAGMPKSTTDFSIARPTTYIGCVN